MPTTKLSQKYQITIPKEIREELGLKRGERIMIKLIKNKKAAIEPIKVSLVEKYKGMGRKVWKKLGGVKKYLTKERALWE